MIHHESQIMSNTADSNWLNYSVEIGKRWIKTNYYSFLFINVEKTKKHEKCQKMTEKEKISTILIIKNYSIFKKAGRIQPNSEPDPKSKWNFKFF